MRRFVWLMGVVAVCVCCGCGVDPFGGSCPPRNPEVQQDVERYGEKHFRVDDVNEVPHEVVIDLASSRALSALDAGGLMWKASELFIPSARALSCVDPDEAYFNAWVEIYRLDVETFEREEQVFSRSVSGSYRRGGDFNLWGEVQAVFAMSSGDEIDMISFEVEDPAIKIDYADSRSDDYDLGVVESADMGQQEWAD